MNAVQDIVSACIVLFCWIVIGGAILYAVLRDERDGEWD